MSDYPEGPGFDFVSAANEALNAHARYVADDGERPYKHYDLDVHAAEGRITRLLADLMHLAAEAGLPNLQELLREAHQSYAIRRKAEPFGLDDTVTDGTRYGYISGIPLDHLDRHCYEVQWLGAVFPETEDRAHLRYINQPLAFDLPTVTNVGQVLERMTELRAVLELQATAGEPLDRRTERCYDGDLAELTEWSGLTEKQIVYGLRPRIDLARKRQHALSGEANPASLAAGECPATPSTSGTAPALPTPLPHPTDPPAEKRSPRP